MNIGRPELVWDSHLNHVGYMLRDMFINSKYSDVVLVCEDGGRFKVHRNVLSSCSEKFKEIFEDDENISSMFLYGIVSFELFPILELMYLGQTLINQEKTEGVLGVAEKLKIKNFSNILEINGIENVKCEDEGINSKAAPPDSRPDPTSEYDVFIETIDIEDNIMKDKCAIGKKVVVAESLEIENFSNPLKNNLTEKISGDNENFDFYAPSQEQNEITEENEMFLQSLVDKSKEEKCAVGKKLVPKLPRRKLKGKKENEIELYQCDSCDYKTVNRHHMARHKQSKHLKEFLKCDKCNYQTKRDDSLEEHYNFEHLGIRYTCHLCQYITANKSRFKVHMKRIHKEDLRPASRKIDLSSFANMN